MNLHGKVALVTGITGTVGSRIADRLIREGARVRALVRRPGPVAGFEHLDVEYVQGDLTDAAAVSAAAQGADLVIHSAAYIGGDWELSKRANVVGTQNMVAAAVAARVGLFVHISTISVYNLYHATAFDETSPLCSDPQNPYQATKVEAERAVWAAAEQGLPVLVIRPCNVLSARPGSYWGEAWLKRVAQGFNRWHPDERFPWIHVENLVDLTMLTISKPECVGEAYTAVDGQVSGAEYWGRLAKWTGNDKKPEGEPRGWDFNVEKSRSLGYSPKVSFEEAMAEIEAFARSQGYHGQSATGKSQHA